MLNVSDFEVNPIPREENSLQMLAMDYIYERTDRTFKKLYDEITPRIRNFIFGYIKSVKDIVDLDDIFSNVMYKAITNLSTYNPNISNFSTWIFTIAKNECLVVLRDCKRKRKTFVSYDKYSGNESKNDEHSNLDDFYRSSKMANNILESMEEFKDKFEYIEELEIRKQNIKLIFIAIDKALTDLSKSILIDRDVNMLSYKDISIKYNLPLNTVKTKIHFARKYVREYLYENTKFRKTEVCVG